MKQIEELFIRMQEKKSPLKKKWRITEDFENCRLIFTHYHHVIAVYDVEKKTLLYEWWEVPADKRGLDAIKYFLPLYNEVMKQHFHRLF